MRSDRMLESLCLIPSMKLGSESLWCDVSHWTIHSPTCDLRAHEPLGFIWGLPTIVPACPKKIFEQSPRKKYVDIVTDALHASSSDLITWNIWP